MFQIWIFPVETIRYFYPEGALWCKHFAELWVGGGCSRWDRSFSLLCRFSQLTRLLLLLSRPLSVFWWEEPSCQHFLLSCRECRSSQIWSALSRLQKDSRNACLWDLLSGWSLQFFLSDSRSAALFSQTFCWAGPDAADGILLYYLDTHSCRFPFCSRHSPLLGLKAFSWGSKIVDFVKAMAVLKIWMDKIK